MSGVGKYERTPEIRARQAAAMKGTVLSADTRRKISEAGRGRKHGNIAAGFKISGGYIVLTGQYGHPLADRTGQLGEHRKALYEKIGPGTHECHWNSVSGCGKTELVWGGKKGIVADHLDGDKTNNNQDNLVPACLACNNRRRLEGNPPDWNGQRTRCPHGHLLSAENTFMSKGYPECLVCQRVRRLRRLPKINK